MSDINGAGHGSLHNWKRLHSTPYKTTEYKCRSCGEPFIHAYDHIPNIFDAMKNYGVENHCNVVEKP